MATLFVIIQVLHFCFATSASCSNLPLSPVLQLAWKDVTSKINQGEEKYAELLSLYRKLQQPESVPNVTHPSIIDRSAELCEGMIFQEGVNDTFVAYESMPDLTRAYFGLAAYMNHLAKYSKIVEALKKYPSTQENPNVFSLLFSEVQALYELAKAMVEHGSNTELVGESLRTLIIIIPTLMQTAYLVVDANAPNGPRSGRYLLHSTTEASFCLYTKILTFSFQNHFRLAPEKKHDDIHTVMIDSLVGTKELQLFQGASKRAIYQHTIFRGKILQSYPLKVLEALNKLSPEKAQKTITAIIPSMNKILHLLPKYSCVDNTTEREISRMYRNFPVRSLAARTCSVDNYIGSINLEILYNWSEMSIEAKDSLAMPLFKQPPQIRWAPRASNDLSMDSHFQNLFRIVKHIFVHRYRRSYNDEVFLLSSLMELEESLIPKGRLWESYLAVLENVTRTLHLFASHSPKDTIRSRTFTSTVLSVIFDCIRMINNMDDKVVTVPSIDNAPHEEINISNHFDRLFLIGMAYAQHFGQKGQAKQYLNTITRHSGLLNIWSLFSLESTNRISNL